VTAGTVLKAPRRLTPWLFPKSLICQGQAKDLLSRHLKYESFARARYLLLTSNSQSTPSLTTVKPAEKRKPGRPRKSGVELAAADPVESPVSMRSQLAALQALPPFSDDEDKARLSWRLRAVYGVPDSQPLTLAALKDPEPGERPPYALHFLAALAIIDTPNAEISKRDLKKAIRTRFPYYTTDSPELKVRSRLEPISSAPLHAC
jgi:hypothetical protein